MQVYVVPTLHPAFALRGQEQYLQVIAKDIARAKRISEIGWWPTDDLILCLLGQPDTWQRAYDTLYAWHASKATCSIDVETTGQSRKEQIEPMLCGLSMVGLSAYGTNTGVSIPTRGELPPDWLAALLSLVRAICADPQQPKAFFNFSFDTKVLKRHGFPVYGPIYDGLVMAHVLAPDLKHNLGFTAQLHLDTTAWKEVFRGLEKHATLQDWEKYNALDAIRAQQVLTPLTAEITEKKLWPVVEAQTRWSKVASRMEEFGFWIHEPTRLDFEKKLIYIRDRCIERMREFCGNPGFIPSKPTHAQWYLYEFLKLPVRKWTAKKREPSTSYKGVLEFMADPRVTLPLKEFVKWSEVAHDLATFIVGFKKKLHPDGRLRPSWNPEGQVGSRWSSSPNVQNIPSYIRCMIRPPPGRVYVQADMAQLEYRIIAALSSCRRLLDIFADPNRDAHTEMARYVFKPEVFDSLPEEVRVRLRTIVKRVVYALTYGAMPRRITMSLLEDRKVPLDVRALITLPRVTDIWNGFFTMNPEVTVWRNGLLRFVEEHGFLEIPPLGRRRYFPLPADRNKVFNWPVQTLGSDVVNIALANIDDRLPPTAWPLVHGHDAGLWECDEADGTKVAKIVEEEMEYTLNGPAGPVRLYAEAEIVHAWYEGAEWPHEEVQLAA